MDRGDSWMFGFWTATFGALTIFAVWADVAIAAAFSAMLTAIGATWSVATWYHDK